MGQSYEKAGKLKIDPNDIIGSAKAHNLYFQIILEYSIV
jgi:hypothetical protein